MRNKNRQQRNNINIKKVTKQIFNKFFSLKGPYLSISSNARNELIEFGLKIDTQIKSMKWYRNYILNNLSYIVSAYLNKQYGYNIVSYKNKEKITKKLKKKIKGYKKLKKINN